MQHPYPLAQQLVDAATFGDAAWVCSLLARGADTEGRDETYRTPLHLSVLSGDRQAVQALLEAGADANARDREGATPLHLAARRRDLSLAYLLVTYGADVNAQDWAGSSVLWQAVIVGLSSSAVVQFLRRQGASDTAPNPAGYCARDLAGRLGVPFEPLANECRGH